MHTRTPLLALLVAALVAAGCGTRLPDEAFGSGSDAVETATGADSETARGGTSADGDLAVDGGDAMSSGGGLTAGGTGDDADAGGAAAGDGTPGGSTAGGGTAGGGGTGSAANTASDVGVTATQITVGNITSVGGPIGPEAYSGMLHGAQTFFQALNERGGVNGRKVRFVTCDDRESPDRNNACAQNLIEGQKVFALVGNATPAYAAARYVDSKGVPDVGGQPIGNAYYKYPRLFSILGADVPRNGTQVGDGGKLWRATNLYTYYKQKVGVTKAAVFFYFIPISRTAGLFMADGAKRAGIDVVYYGGGSEAGMNPASPSFDTDVIQMQRRGVEGIWNAIDIAGFQKLCQSMDRYSFEVKANVSTVQGFGRKVSEFSSPCRNSIYVDTESHGYYATNVPQVAEFRNAMKKFDGNFRLHHWALEGWAAAKMFTEGVASMGANVTRDGLVKWLNERPLDYTAGGLMSSTHFRPVDHSKAGTNCYSMSRWQDSAEDFVARAPLGCHPTEWYSYTPQDDGS